ncbi:MAG: carboxylating nicotinate-nucleotide diphosphorylase [Thermoplasmata archaeon]|nr:carboxylating nicotinate-nucleotide diphosphorylase [Thermoplasmata archaeon]
MSPARPSVRHPQLTSGTRELVRRALAEDRARADLTTKRLFPRPFRASAVVTAQARGVLAGLPAAVETARQLGLRARALSRDGARLHSGTRVLRVDGDARAILAGERTILNFLMHLSGVASATDRAVHRARAAQPGFRVRGTRKTTPGLRLLEKAAIEAGGGEPHRRDLASGLLVKNNHLALLPLEEAVRRGKKGSRQPLQVEVHSASQAVRAVRAGADALLLDNLRPPEIRRVLQQLTRLGRAGRVPVELSGGIEESSLARYARTGASSASLGSLTHSAPALPFHLTVVPVRPPPT